MRAPDPPPRAGFTLVEVLLAMALLVILGVMAVGSLQALVESTAAADEALESLHQGETLMDRVVSSLRSAAYFDSDPTLFSFDYEPGSGSPPNDMASWVTSTMSLLPPNHPTREGLNRVFLSIETVDGETGLAVSAYPYLVDPEDDDVPELDPWLLSARVRGLRFRFYDLTRNEWVDDWERDNQIPVSLEVTLELEPVGDSRDPVELVRRVDIPAGKVSRATRRGERRVQDRSAPDTPGRDRAPDTTPRIETPR